MLVKTALGIIGGTLTKTTKMPCRSFSTSPKDCFTGSKLRTVPGSICESCFACKGFYAMYANTIEPAQKKRWNSIDDPLWTDAMALLINKEPGFFRWFDSGDLKSALHLHKIAVVCKKTSHIKHWLPTKERGFYADFIKAGGIVPKNLVIRFSAYMIDQAPPAYKNTSTVHTKGKKAFGIVCRAKSGACGACRLCWNSKVKNVSYPKH